MGSKPKGDQRHCFCSGGLEEGVRGWPWWRRELVGTSAAEVELTGIHFDRFFGASLGFDEEPVNSGHAAFKIRRGAIGRRFIPGSAVAE